LPGTPFNPDAIRVNQLFVLAALRVKPASQPRFIFLLSRTEPECSLLAQKWKLRVLSTGALQLSRRRLGAVCQV
ncbi:MAG: hypothetical protein ACO3M2_09770, partial [Pseudohongiellaceae bacterium]